MPAAPTAPAPAATPSAPKPSTPAPKAAAPTPKAETTPEIPGALDDSFAELDQLAGNKPAPKKKEAAKPKTEPKKEADEKEANNNVSDDSEGDVPRDEGASLEAKTESDPKPSGEKPKEGEGWKRYKELDKTVKREYEPKLKRLSELEAKVKEYESRDDGQMKATQERIAQIEKRNAELESRIKFKDFESSKEYQEGHQKPLEEAWANATRELKGLTMTVEDPKTGESVTREVTPADLAYLANLEPAVRRTEINRLFPEDKEEVKRHINQINHLSEKAEAAKKKAAEEAETYTRTQSEQQQQQQAMRTKMWKSVNETLSTKYPQWFAKVEGDNEGNTLFDRGSALADLVFNPHELTPERIEHLPKIFREAIAAKKPFTQDMLVKAQSIARNKAANHDRLAFQNKALTAKVAELEESLKAFEASSPDNVPAGGARKVNGEVTWERELEALDK